MSPSGLDVTLPFNCTPLPVSLAAGCQNELTRRVQVSWSVRQLYDEDVLEDAARISSDRRQSDAEVQEGA